MDRGRDIIRAHISFRFQSRGHCRVLPIKSSLRKVYVAFPISNIANVLGFPGELLTARACVWEGSERRKKIRANSGALSRANDVTVATNVLFALGSPLIRSRVSVSLLREKLPNHKEDVTRLGARNSKSIRVVLGRNQRISRGFRGKLVENTEG